MSTNILAPFGALVLVGGFLVVGINKTTTDHFQVESSSVSSSYHHPIMDEVEDEFDKNFDPEKVHINILDKKGRPAKGVSLEFCIPDTEECTRGIHVGDGTYQPDKDIFGGLKEIL